MTVYFRPIEEHAKRVPRLQKDLIVDVRNSVEDELEMEKEQQEKK
jgi:hypothetical protein